MCIALLDYKLAKKADSLFSTFWLFTIRAVSNENPSLPVMKDLFSKYFAYGDSKKDYIRIDFLKILQEEVLLGFFETETEL